MAIIECSLFLILGVMQVLRAQRFCSFLIFCKCMMAKRTKKVEGNMIRNGTHENKQCLYMKCQCCYLYHRTSLLFPSGHHSSVLSPTTVKTKQQIDTDTTNNNHLKI